MADRSDNARIAGNVVNDDLLGSLEFACAVAGAKVLLLFQIVGAMYDLATGIVEFLPQG